MVHCRVLASSEEVNLWPMVICSGMYAGSCNGVSESVFLVVVFMAWTVGSWCWLYIGQSCVGCGVKFLDVSTINHRGQCCIMCWYVFCYCYVCCWLCNCWDLGVINVLERCHYIGWWWNSRIKFVNSFIVISICVGSRVVAGRKVIQRVTIA